MLAFKFFGTHSWLYAGYRVTIFSTGEEQALEGPNGLGGNVQFYPVNALAETGARGESIANWHSNVVVDRELITGQQPMSAPEFGDEMTDFRQAYSELREATNPNDP
jgi:putative intracellular protease/amidase